jgi:hypothetical protein
LRAYITHHPLDNAQACVDTYSDCR